MCAAQEKIISHIKEMLESFNSETKELCATNRDLQTYIDCCHQESERHALYPEQGIVHFNNMANITIDNNSITPQRRQNEREEHHQKDCQILFNKNEENKSIIASKTIE